MISNAYALDAVVTVLEAPIFKSKDINSPVVQYARKGDIIKVDPSLLNQAHKSASLDDEFISTWDRQGNVTYVLAKHIYVYLENQKELEQEITQHDPTDYRLTEPLPKNYPFIKEGGLRVQFTAGAALPYQVNYPYESSVKAKGYSNPIDVNLAMLKRAPDDKNDRFYLGGVFNYRSFENNFYLFNGRSSYERGMKFGIGPLASYDAFKGDKNRIVLYGSINFNFFNQLSITQESETASDKRTYRAMNFTPKFGVQYHRKNIYEGLDFVAGTAMEYESPANFAAQNGAHQDNWWKNEGSDTFRASSFYTLTGYLGLQSYY